MDYVWQPDVIPGLGLYRCSGFEWWWRSILLNIPVVALVTMVAGWVVSYLMTKKKRVKLWLFSSGSLVIFFLAWRWFLSMGSGGMWKLWVEPLCIVHGR
jgi:hypothetical protein